MGYAATTAVQTCALMGQKKTVEHQDRRLLHHLLLDLRQHPQPTSLSPHPQLRGGHNHPEVLTLSHHLQLPGNPLHRDHTHLEVLTLSHRLPGNLLHQPTRNPLSLSNPQHMATCPPQLSRSASRCLVMARPIHPASPLHAPIKLFAPPAPTIPDLLATEEGRVMDILKAWILKYSPLGDLLAMEVAE